MKNVSFPMNYFTNIFTPKRTFTGRNSLSIVQMIVVILFLTSLLLAPISINLFKSTNFELNQIMPTMFHELDENVVMNIQKTDVNVSEVKYLNSEKTVALNLEQKDFDQLVSGVSFNQTEMWLKDRTKYEFKVRYTKDFDLAKISTITELKEQVQNQWLQQNKAFVAFTILLMSGSLILISTVFLVLGGGFFLWLTRKNQYSSIKSYKESLTIMLNCLGLSSLVAMLSGLISFDVIIILSIQSFGLVMMLIAVFLQTKFNDEYVLK